MNLTSQSYLLFCPNLATLEATAQTHARQFNPADVFWLKPREGEKSIMVADIATFLDKVQLGAVGGKKLLIISDTSTMTAVAQNKMLKTIEEPRHDTIFLLLATDEYKILPTIKSRCVKLYIQSTNTSEINPDELERAKKLLECKTLDAALKFLPVNLVAVDAAASLLPLRCPRTHAIIRVMAEIHRNVAANCNASNAADLLLMELFK
ncbi:MAG: hypothetical protein FWE38_02190 [Firmicutes bacterium]|nr:hypothetical protein [Bacillota bacterium]